MKLKNYIFLMFAVVFYTTISLYSYEVFNTPARDWIEKAYLPTLCGQILYVGVGSYTQNYPYLTKNPTQFSTIDYDSEKACFGSPYGHYIADFLTFHPSTNFDHISLFGVMGHPPTVVTSKYTIIDGITIFQAINQAHRLIKIGGTLQLGPNHKDFIGQDATFWCDQFTKPPLDNYQIIFSAIYSDNIVWWGRKIKE